MLNWLKEHMNRQEPKRKEGGLLENEYTPAGSSHDVDKHDEQVRRQIVESISSRHFSELSQAEIQSMQAALTANRQDFGDIKELQGMIGNPEFCGVLRELGKTIGEYQAKQSSSSEEMEKSTSDRYQEKFVNALRRLSMMDPSCDQEKLITYVQAASRVSGQKPLTYDAGMGIYLSAVNEVL